MRMRCRYSDPPRAFSARCVPVALLGWLACATSCDGSMLLTEEHVAITNGVIDDEHPAVGLVLRQSKTSAQLCSGTLIGRQTVLTAGHCLHALKATEEVTFYLGANWPEEILGLPFEVTRVTLHPQFQLSDSSGPENDIALLELAIAAEVAPLPIAAIRPTVGALITLSGYGTTADGALDYGQRRMARSQVDGVAAKVFAYAGVADGWGNVCFGDSGGPTLVRYAGNTVQIGVHSVALSNDPDQVCGLRGGDVRVDAYLSWIEEAGRGDVIVQPTAIDNQTPTVAIVSPADGAMVSSEFTVEISATDDVSIAHVELDVDGTLYAVDHTSPYRFVVQLSAGTQYQLAARAIDTVGLIAQDTVSVDVVSVAKPLADTEPEGDAVSEEALPSDDGALPEDKIAQTDEPDPGETSPDAEGVGGPDLVSPRGCAIADQAHGALFLLALLALLTFRRGRPRDPVTRPTAC